jgi:hypothetical protein
MQKEFIFSAFSLSGMGHIDACDVKFRLMCDAIVHIGSQRLDAADRLKPNCFKIGEVKQRSVLEPCPYSRQRTLQEWENKIKKQPRGRTEQGTLPQLLRIHVRKRGIHYQLRIICQSVATNHHVGRKNTNYVDHVVIISDH